ncbi:unnamed protein product [Parajaminaea phylloscopi]
MVGTRAKRRRTEGVQIDFDDDGRAESYEQARLANMQANAALMASLGLQSDRHRPAAPVKRKLKEVPPIRRVVSTRSTRVVETESPEPNVFDDAAEADAYEKQRLQTMKENASLLASLGIQGPQKQLQALANPAQPKPKPVKAPKGPKVKQSLGPPGSPPNGTRRSSRAVERVDYSRTKSLQALAEASRRRTTASRSNSFIVLDDDNDDEAEERAATAAEYAERCFRDYVLPQSRTAARGAGSDNEVQGTSRTPYANALVRRAFIPLQRRHSPQTFGTIPGTNVGDWFALRAGASLTAIHAPLVAGISGSAERGCFSICLSGGYPDDIDTGDTVIFSGSGGRDLKGTPSNPKNLRTAPQIRDQTFDDNHFNASLQRSQITGKPVRVLRGFKGKRPFAPPMGYIYSGLYKVTEAWSEVGCTGFLVCRFRLERCPNQIPLPTFVYEDEGSTENQVPVSERQRPSSGVAAAQSTRRFTKATSPASSSSSASYSSALTELSPPPETPRPAVPCPVSLRQTGEWWVVIETKYGPRLK